MSFVNTIDQLGDDVVIKMIIEGTITELSDEILTKVGSYCFSECESLRSINLPNVTEIRDYAFGNTFGLVDVNLPKLKTAKAGAFASSGIETINLPMLEIIPQDFMQFAKVAKVDLGCATNMGTSGFKWCGNLVTLIIRSNTVATALTTSIVGNSAISKGTGYIYVPKALIEQYKVATNWSVYANQFRAIEDYPDICG